MKKQNGFTLIELVVVMVILGILAAVALPKFVNMSSDARIAKMQGAVGAVQSASALAHAKYLAGGATAASIDMEGTPVALTNGYPSASAIAAAAGLDSNFATTVAGDTVTIAESKSTDGTTTTLSDCKFTYKNAASGSAPELTTSGLTSTNCK